MNRMTSKERMLAVLTGEKPDYIPCSIYFNNNLRIAGYDLGNPEERIKCYIDLGTEPVIDVNLPGVQPYEQVKINVWTEEITGEKYPVIFKEYITPEGTLRQGVYRTDDWPFGDDIPFPGNDHCASNNYEPLIKSPDDVAAFKYLWGKPKDNDIETFRESISGLINLADKYDVITRATVGQGLASLMFLMGAENFVLFAVDYPEAFKELAVFEHIMTLERMKIADRYGIDLFKRFGGYEQTNFFSPSIYKDIVVPLVRREVIEAQKIGTPMYYRVVTGMKPILSDIADIGFDCVEGFEPELSNCSNDDIRKVLGGKSVVWTGVSSPVCLNAKDDNLTREAVRDAMEVFEGTGFILGVTNSIRQHFNWDNTLALVDEWKKCVGR
ncbi:MAG: hypothetical protein KAH14_04150 [Clostridiales bacterium]|nr:hypothetical protein [Clostridiales bacterium]